MCYIEFLRSLSHVEIYIYIEIVLFAPGLWLPYSSHKMSAFGLTVGLLCAVYTYVDG